MTGVPAFLVALIGGVALDRLTGGAQLSPRDRPSER